MNRQEYFANWAKKSNTSTDEFEKEFQERLQKSNADFPQMSTEEREKYILSLIQTSLKRQLSSNAAKFVGMFISVDDPRDSNNFAKDDAKKRGSVSADGIPVWWADHVSVKVHKINKVGEPIKEKMQRTSFGVFYEEKEGMPSELHVGAFYDAENLNRVPPLNQWVRFRANCSKGLQEGKYSINGASVTDFKEATGIHSEIATMGARDVIKRYFGSGACPSFKELPSFVAKDNKLPFGLSIVRGVVSDIKFLPNTGKALIEIANPDLDAMLDDSPGIISGFFAESLPVDFGIGSTSLFLGRLSFKAEKNQYNMNVTGMIPERMVAVPANLQKIVDNGFEEEM